MQTIFIPPRILPRWRPGFHLTISDRAPWLAALHELLSSTLHSNHHPILACSALKHKYRVQLLDGLAGLEIIYLKGTYDLIWSRMSAREGHYMKPEMLQSQLAALEEPMDAFAVDISIPLNDMIDKIIARYFYNAPGHTPYARTGV